MTISKNETVRNARKEAEDLIRNATILEGLSTLPNDLDYTIEHDCIAIWLPYDIRMFVKIRHLLPNGYKRRPGKVYPTKTGSRLYTYIKNGHVDINLWLYPPNGIADNCKLIYEDITRREVVGVTCTKETK